MYSCLDSSVAERLLGKKKAGSSILPPGSKFPLPAPPSSRVQKERDQLFTIHPAVPLVLFGIIGSWFTRCQTTLSDRDIPQTPAPPASTETPSFVPTVVLPPERSPTPAATPKPKETLFSAAMSPLFAAARERRTRAAATDPSYFHRVNPLFDEQNTLTILNIGCGETHEPPMTEWAFICANTLFIFDATNQTEREIIFTHDVRAPEVEYALGIYGQKGSTKRLEQAWLDPKVGGFALTRTVFENATALPVDIIVAATRDEIYRKIVNDVFGTVEITNDREITIHPIYVGGSATQRGKKLPERRFPAGIISLDGDGALQWIKGVPKAIRHRADQEHQERADRAKEAIAAKAKQEAANPRLYLLLTKVITEELFSGGIRTDANLLGWAKHVGELAAYGDVWRGSPDDSFANFPTRLPQTYFVDKSTSIHEFVPVRFVDPAVDDACIRRDFAREIYPNRNFEVPLYADADLQPDRLADTYWPVPRATVAFIMTNNRYPDPGEIPLPTTRCR